MEYHYDKDRIPGGPDPADTQANALGQDTQDRADGPAPTYGTPANSAQSAGQYNYWPYTAPAQPSYQYTPPNNNEPRYEARYVPQYEVHEDAGAGGGGKKRGAAGKVLGGIALVVACAVAGFGGGYAAIVSYQGDTSIVDNAPVGDTVNPSGINTTDDMSVSEIAAKAGPSVVSIITENMVSDNFTGGRVVSGAGSGVIISEDGTIVTNHHVISGAQNITVTLADGTEYPATVLGSDANTDVAVLKINAAGLTPATIGDSDNINVGDFCIAIGNPMGTLGGTVTDGIVSALDRQITIDGYTMNLLQMSAAVSPGNSGGGLFNGRGELVGIVNAKSSGEGVEGLGFAIPSNAAMEIVESILNNGYVSRAGLGVSVNNPTTQEEARQLGYEQPGVYIAELSAGGAAERGGLQVEDRLVEADGVSITTLQDLRGVLDNHAVGDTIDVTVERGGTTLGLTVTLQELSNQ